MNHTSDLPYDTRDMKHPMITADVMLPSQYVDMCKAYGETSSPDKRLALAVLEQAINEYQLFTEHNRETCYWCIKHREKRIGGHPCRRRDRYLDARDWLIEERDPNRPFSYEWVCNALSIDAEWLRAGLLAWEGRLPRRSPVNEPNIMVRTYERRT